jgi:hypothetical protein
MQDRDLLQDRHHLPAVEEFELPRPPWFPEEQDLVVFRARRGLHSAEEGKS